MKRPPRPLLLVEDSTEDEFLILRAWRQAGLQARIDIARDGQQALDYLFGEGEFADREPAPLPALVVLDLDLPRVGGFEVLQKLRQHPLTRAVPVVVLTSSDDRGDCARCYQLGANSFVAKPVDALAFRDTLTRIGQYWLHDNISCLP